jgi:hypothetical protein
MQRLQRFWESLRMDRGPRVNIGAILRGQRVWEIGGEVYPAWRAKSGWSFHLAMHAAVGGSATLQSRHSLGE